LFLGSFLTCGSAGTEKLRDAAPFLVTALNQNHFIVNATFVPLRLASSFMPGYGQRRGR
jgi:hypothetical protein